MNVTLGFILASVPVWSAAQVIVPARATAETLLDTVVNFAKTDGVQALLRETNHAQGRFHTRETGKPYLVIYDLAGKTLAHASDIRHVGMDHSRVLGRLLELAQRQTRGWYEPGHGAMDHEAVCYERLGNILITVNLPPRP